jgi:hypothetical protein
LNNAQKHKSENLTTTQLHWREVKAAIASMEMSMDMFQQNFMDNEL